MAFQKNVHESDCLIPDGNQKDQYLYLLEKEEFQKFQELLDRPTQMKPGLKKLLEEKAPWE